MSTPTAAPETSSDIEADWEEVDREAVNPDAVSTADSHRGTTSTQAGTPKYELLLCPSSKGFPPIIELAFYPLWLKSSITAELKNAGLSLASFTWRHRANEAEEAIKGGNLTLFRRCAATAVKEVTDEMARLERISTYPSGVAYRREIAVLESLLQSVQTQIGTGIRVEQWLEKATDALESEIKTHLPDDAWKYSCHRSWNSFNAARGNKPLLRPSLYQTEGVLVVHITETSAPSAVHPEFEQLIDTHVKWKLCGSRDGTIPAEISLYRDFWIRRHLCDGSSLQFLRRNGITPSVPKVDLSVVIDYLRTDRWMEGEQKRELNRARKTSGPNERDKLRASYANDACDACETMEQRLSGRFGIEVSSDKQALDDVDAVHRVLGWPTSSILSGPEQDGSH